MSDYIPFEIQSEIINRLPVKSVVQCRSVSKLWKSFIDSSKFINSYHTCRTKTQNYLLVRYMLANEVKYISIVDDDTFPNQKSSIDVPEDLVSLLKDALIFGSVNGLICFTCSCQDHMDEKIAVLWNPSVRKSVGVTIPNYFYDLTGHTYIGFGVCPSTNDPKLVKINTIGFPTVFNWEVEVFTLSTRVWKSVSNIPSAFRTCHLTSSRVFVDGFIYWRGYDKSKLAEGISSNLIISFDLKSHEFGEVCLPDRLVHSNGLEVRKVFESLGLFEYYDDGKTRFIDVWIMKEGITKSFTKMLTIKAPNSLASYRVLELRKNGEVIFENIDDTNSSTVEVYEPSSGHMNGIGFYGNSDSFSMNSYMETLLLLDQPNSTIIY